LRRPWPKRRPQSPPSSAGSSNPLPTSTPLSSAQRKKPANYRTFRSAPRGTTLAVSSGNLVLIALCGETKHFQTSCLCTAGRQKAPLTPPTRDWVGNWVNCSTSSTSCDCPKIDAQYIVFTRLTNQECQRILVGRGATRSMSEKPPAFSVRPHRSSRRINLDAFDRSAPGAGASVSIGVHR